MSGVNKVILLGNLGADPEVRSLPSGSKVANISIATSEAYMKAGERIEQTEWHKVELWDKLAELAEKYLEKGRTVYIEGKLRTNTYQDKDGITRYDKKIRATNMTFVGGKNDDAESMSQAQRSQPQPSQSHAAASQPAPTGPASEPDSDDLPF
ncbi:MAG: single-stranded DNA-binding protein [Cyclobacteriaceae bacterium]